MVNFSYITYVLAIAGFASSQSLASTKGGDGASTSAASRGSGIAKGSGRPVRSGVAAPTGAVPSGQTGAPSIAPSDSLPPLSLLGSKREAQQSPPPQVKTSVGPPLSRPSPTGANIPPPPSDAPSATRRATGIARRQVSASSPIPPPGGSPLPKPSGARPSGPPPSGVPSGAPGADIQEQKFSKLPPNFDSTSSVTPRPTGAGKQRV